jgi:hypothetical protein
MKNIEFWDVYYGRQAYNVLTELAVSLIITLKMETAGFL